MRRLFIAGWVCLPGCTSPNPAFGSRSQGDSTGTETGKETGVASTTPVETTGASSDPTTGDPQTSDESSGWTTQSDTEANTCEFDEMTGIAVQVHHNGEAIAVCPKLVMNGDAESIGEGRWNVSDCGCDANDCTDTYEVEIIAPLPVPDLPPCVRIEFTGRAANGATCEFSGVRIHQGSLSLDPNNAPPLYVGSHRRGSADGPLQMSLLVTEDLIESCDCGVDCCESAGLEAGQYVLQFYTGIEQMPPIPMNEYSEFRTGPNGTPLAPYGNAKLWDVAVTGSHVHATCDEPPHFTWMIRAQPG